MALIAAGTVVFDGRVCRPGWVQTSGARILAGGPGVPAGPVDCADVDFPDAIVVPGFVDIHTHGGGGAWYADGPEKAGRAAAFHHRHGTTTTLASLVSAAPEVLLRAVRGLATAARRGVIAGIHLEGPWLSPRRCGAHDHRQLRDPDPAEIDTLLDAGDGMIRMVTLAPERPGGLAAIKQLVDAGVVVAVGHTDASYDQARAAIEVGARVATHLFNAMPPLHHREPGPALALLDDPRVTVEVIADGVHVHPALVRHVVDAAGPDRVAFVTDAIAAAGAKAGCFRLGGVAVDVVDGVARVRGSSTIAGGTATMDRLFATAAALRGADTDAGLVEAVRLTAATPARALGLAHTGGLRPGFDADLVVLDRDLRALRVLRRGRWVAGEPTADGAESLD